MKKSEQAMKAFIEVRNELINTGNITAHILSWKKPYIFYLENNKNKAIEILKAEAIAKI